MLADSFGVSAGHNGGPPLAGVLGLASRGASGSGTLVLVLGGLAVTGLWLLRLYTHPWGPCWWCGGSGRNGGSKARSWGRCWRCKGRGERLRPAARVLYKALGREAK